MKAPSKRETPRSTTPPSSNGNATPKAAKTKPKRSVKPGVGLSGSMDAKRRASLVLEVLSGLRTPFDASVVLGISPQRYYMLESRALQALVTALEPRGPGRQPSPEKDLRRLFKERDRLSRELLRAQALVRVAQRAIGVTPPEKPTAKPGARKRSRRPTVRARQAVERLREDIEVERASQVSIVNAAELDGAVVSPASS